MAESECSLQQLLATMLNVNFGIADLDMPWISPTTTPREVKENDNFQDLKEEAMLKVSAVFRF